MEIKKIEEVYVGGVEDTLILRDDYMRPLDAETVRDKIARFLVEKYSIQTIMETDEIMCYNSKTGLYKEDENYIVNRIQRIMDVNSLSNIATQSFINETVSLIKRRTYIRRDVFFAPSNLIPFRNGVLDLNPNGIGFVEYSPKYRFISKLNVDYSPNAQCPEFDSFLDEITATEDDKIRIYQLIGYCLYRDYPIHRAFMFVGEGANGKSVLLKTIEEIIGKENVSHLSLQQLETEKFAISALDGKFANIYADLSSTDLRTTGRFKNLTSGDPILVEKKFGGTYSLKNTAKFIFSCNQLPKVYDDTDGFYRRWLILIFPNQFLDGVNADPNKLKKLITEEEKSGIVNKALLWLEQLILQNRFYKEDDVDTKRDTYRRLSSSILTFIDECITYSNNYIRKDELYQEYLKFCSQNHMPVSSEKKFFSTVKTELRIDEQRIETVEGRKRVFFGISFKKAEN